MIASAPTTESPGEFGHFAEASGLQHSKDLFDELELFVGRCTSHIRRLRAAQDEFRTAEGTDLLCEFVDEGDMLEAIWSNVCRRIQSEYIGAMKVDVPDLPRFIALSLGWREPSSYRTTTRTGGSLLGSVRQSCAKG